MSVPKVVGIETEYGIATHNTRADMGQSASAAIDPISASEILLGQLSAQNLITVPHYDCAYDNRKDRARIGKGTEIGSPTLFKVNGSTNLGASYYDWMLANGARLYIDHAHPEYCTPECRTVRSLIAADKAGEIILERCSQAVLENGALPPGHRIALYKNNSDHKGNSYGCHENYLLKASLYEDLLYRQPEIVNAHLLPFLITRTIYSGSGKVGSENGTSPAGFQLSQRADFFETLVGIQTTHRRPLFNTRDEAHAATAKHRRLHVIVGDANMADLSTYLKVGPMLILFRMMEDSFLTSDFSLVDPLIAFRVVSRDLTFQEKLPLQNGESLTALEIQRRYLLLARKYLKAKRSRTEEHEIVKQWKAALDALERDWRSLASSLDWAIKRRLLEHYLSSQQTTWTEVQQWQVVIEKIMEAETQTAVAYGQGSRQELSTSPQWRAAMQQFLTEKNLSLMEYTRQVDIYFGLRRLDLEYHDIRRGPTANEMGLFYRLQHDRLIKRIVSDAEIARHVARAPLGTRAWFRGKSLEQFSSVIAWSDWSQMAFTAASPGAGDNVIMVMDNPVSEYRKNAKRVWTKLVKTYRKNGRSKSKVS